MGAVRLPRGRHPLDRIDDHIAVRIVVRDGNDSGAAGSKFEDSQRQEEAVFCRHLATQVWYS